MSAAVHVLHAADINGFPVRFFRSLLEGPDCPFVSLLDLLSAAKFPPGSRKLFLKNLPRDFPEEVATLAVEDGGSVEIVRACSHGMANGVFDIAKRIGADDIEIAYRVAAFDALDKTVAERQLEGSAAFSYSLAAVLR